MVMIFCEFLSFQMKKAVFGYLAFPSVLFTQHPYLAHLVFMVAVFLKPHLIVSTNDISLKA